MTKRQWGVLLIVVALLIVIAGGVLTNILQPTKQEQLVSDLRAEGIPVVDERAMLAIIDDSCPILDTSYAPIDNLRNEGLTTEQAFDTIAIVRYSEYCK